VQDTGHVTHATAIQGHLEQLRCDVRDATMMAVVDENRVIRTARRRTAGPWFPWGSDSMFHHLGVLTRGTTHLEEGHGDLHYRAYERHSGD
jgi:hypothetical protein